MAWTPRPRENATSVRRPSRTAIEAQAFAHRVDERDRRQRLEQQRRQMVDDTRHRPEDSSPAIRRLLGYDQPSRPPRRWEAQPGWNGQLEYVDVGPVEPVE